MSNLLENQNINLNTLVRRGAAFVVFVVSFSGVYHRWNSNTEEIEEMKETISVLQSNDSEGDKRLSIIEEHLSILKKDSSEMKYDISQMKDSTSEILEWLKKN